ncbi:hypothetical protein SDC9_160652 [bioreactor metagenome]|uniref:Uncharacterized protein n=1 Tax=bioreactor metagenome TaxID=1076179 RepID=A0A645FG45_9ZZZZ
MIICGLFTAPVNISRRRETVLCWKQKRHFYLLRRLQTLKRKDILSVLKEILPLQFWIISRRRLNYLSSAVSELICFLSCLAEIGMTEWIWSDEMAEKAYGLRFSERFVFKDCQKSLCWTIRQRQKNTIYMLWSCLTAPIKHITANGTAGHITVTVKR